MANKHWLSIVILALVTVFLDTMNYALIVPILPYLVKELNSTSFEEGILFSSYSILQLISLLIAGPLSDIYGRKPFLLLSLFGSCLGSILQGMSRSMTSLIIWRSFTGLFAGSLILVQAVIADVIPTEKRNVYLSRLEGIVSVSFIVGPAIGGVLAQVDNHFPFFAAGVVSGLAMIVALIWLKESHPLLVDENGKQIRKKVERSTTGSSGGKKATRVKPRITPLIMMCFVNEFCVKWSINAFDSRYGIYLTDRWNVSSPVFSSLITIQSVFNCLLQLFVYPWCVSKLNIPIPYLAICGAVTMFCSYLGMVLSSTALASMIWSSILWFGVSFISPASVTIISSTSAKEVQGTVLSWNNFCNQASMISSPLILAAIYTHSPDGVYFFSSITAVISTTIMIILSCRKDAKTLGKASEVTPTSIELPVVKEDIKQEQEQKNGVESKSALEMNANDAKADITMSSPTPAKPTQLAMPEEQAVTVTATKTTVI